MVLDIKRGLASIPGGTPWTTDSINKEFIRIFRLGIKESRSGNGLPKQGAEPLSPIVASLILYVSTPEYYLSLGIRDDTPGIPSPGFLGISSIIALLCSLQDGLRTGELTAKHV